MYNKLLLLLLLYGSVDFGRLDFQLNVVYLNDPHSHFLETKGDGGTCTRNESEQGLCFGGIARKVAKIQEIRKRDKNVIVLSTGDVFMGLLLNSSHELRLASTLFPYFGINVTAIGNRAFDDGYYDAITFIMALKVPIVCCNVIGRKGSVWQNHVSKSVILNVDGEKVGVVGFIHPDTEIRTGSSLRLTDELPCLKEEVKKLQALKVDKIIAIGHSKNLEKAMATGVPGMDMIIGDNSQVFLYKIDDESLTMSNSHSTTSLRVHPKVLQQMPTGEVAGIDEHRFTKTIISPIGKIPPNGKYLGYLKLTFNNNGHVVNYSNDQILLDKKVPKDVATEKELMKVLKVLETAKKRKHMSPYRTVLGNSLFGLTGGLKCRLKECSLGNFVTDAAMYAFKHRANDFSDWVAPDAAVWNAGNLRASIPAGNITMRNLLHAVHLGDMMEVTNITGRGLKQMMENAVGDYDVNGVTPSNAFLQISGMCVNYDLSKPQNQRVTNLEIRCRTGNRSSFEPVDLSKVYNIVMPHFMKNGGDEYARFDFEPFGKEIPDTHILSEYLLNKSPISISIENRITFKRETPDRLPKRYVDNRNMSSQVSDENVTVVHAKKNAENITPNAEKTSVSASIINEKVSSDSDELANTDSSSILFMVVMKDRNTTSDINSVKDNQRMLGNGENYFSSSMNESHINNHSADGRARRRSEDGLDKLFGDDIFLPEKAKVLGNINTLNKTHMPNGTNAITGRKYEPHFSIPKYSRIFPMNFPFHHHKTIKKDLSSLYHDRFTIREKMFLDWPDWIFGPEILKSTKSLKPDIAENSILFNSTTSSASGKFREGFVVINNSLKKRRSNSAIYLNPHPNLKATPLHLRNRTTTESHLTEINSLAYVQNGTNRPSMNPSAKERFVAGIPNGVNLDMNTVSASTVSTYIKEVESVNHSLKVTNDINNIQHDGRATSQPDSSYDVLTTLGSGHTLTEVYSINNKNSSNPVIKFPDLKAATELLFHNISAEGTSTLKPNTSRFRNNEKHTVNEAKSSEITTKCSKIESSNAVDQNRDPNGKGKKVPNLLLPKEMVKNGMIDRNETEAIEISQKKTAHQETTKSGNESNILNIIKNGKILQDETTTKSYKFLQIENVTKMLSSSRSAKTFIKTETDFVTVMSANVVNNSGTVNATKLHVNDINKTRILKPADLLAKGTNYNTDLPFSRQTFNHSKELANEATTLVQFQANKFSTINLESSTVQTEEIGFLVTEEHFNTAFPYTKIHRKGGGITMKHDANNATKDSPFSPVSTNSSKIETNLSKPQNPVDLNSDSSRMHVEESESNLQDENPISSESNRFDTTVDKTGKSIISTQFIISNVNNSTEHGERKVSSIPRRISNSTEIKASYERKNSSSTVRFVSTDPFTAVDSSAPIVLPLHTTDTAKKYSNENIISMSGIVSNSSGMTLHHDDNISMPVSLNSTVKTYQTCNSSESNEACFGGTSLELTTIKTRISPQITATDISNLMQLSEVKVPPRMTSENSPAMNLGVINASLIPLKTIDQPNNPSNEKATETPSEVNKSSEISLDHASYSSSSSLQLKSTYSPMEEKGSNAPLPRFSGSSDGSKQPFERNVTVRHNITHASALNLQNNSLSQDSIPTGLPKQINANIPSSDISMADKKSKSHEGKNLSAKTSLGRENDHSIKINNPQDNSSSHTVLKNHLTENGLFITTEQKATTFLKDLTKTTEDSSKTSAPSAPSNSESSVSGLNVEPMESSNSEKAMNASKEATSSSKYYNNTSGVFVTPRITSNGDVKREAHMSSVNANSINASLHVKDATNFGRMVSNEKQSTTEKKVPTEEQAPATKKVTTEGQTPTERKVPGEKQVLAGEQIPTEKQVLTESQAPTEKEVPTEEQISTEKKIPTEEQILAEKEVLTERETTTEKMKNRHHNYRKAALRPWDFLRLVFLKAF